jgi:hypothetical protein
MVVTLGVMVVKGDDKRGESRLGGGLAMDALGEEWTCRVALLGEGWEACLSSSS